MKASCVPAGNVADTSSPKDGPCAAICGHTLGGFYQFDTATSVSLLPTFRLLRARSEPLLPDGLPSRRATYATALFRRSYLVYRGGRTYIAAFTC